MILAADIGGTKSLLALFQWRDYFLDTIFVRRYASRDFTSLEDVVRTFLTDYAALQGSIQIESACFGVAGAISNGTSYLVNLGWTVSKRALCATFPEIIHIDLCNDLEATGYGLPLLPIEDFVCLTPQKNNPNHPFRIESNHRCAILAPGTGLGEAFLLKNRVFPSEGAHCDFGPRSEREIRLWRYLHKIYGHVSYERILSGQGLCHLERFFRAEWGEKQDCALLHPEEITRLALAAECPICQAALDQYVDIMGAEAGNLALKFLALDGIYLGGGIPSKILPKLREETFLRSFYAKGRFKDLLANTPVFVIENANTALYGAANLAAKYIHPSGSLQSISPPSQAT
jgi:glucokinase